ncbi:hypothetical protein BAMBUS_01110 [Brevundimonas phage vB_BpoS-Bambus]|nr:hypothetical protein BAMBUS_01110 [Brevundimonas phage vB_BpoS-Bambus]
MTAVSEDTWARLRAQVETFQGELIVTAEARLRREFREAVAATGWDGRRCCIDPRKAYRADFVHVQRMMHFWCGLVREEYGLPGSAFLKAQRDLFRTFNAGLSPWDPQVTQLLAEHAGTPVWTRRGVRLAVRDLKRLFEAAA